ncbi:restriction endonuclease subunit S [Selenomonas sp.]|jgi:type I restriction enzyme, S subunit|uniref:restriction endonuclease subunit S n=1 Tax=Selenomonas sp. TaxID=2053611 RepID=UPI003A100CC7
MAKKKQALSPEERLAAALVPEEEWPYALPDGWKWVYLSGILDVSKEKTEEFPPDTKYVGLENIEKDTGRIQAVDAEGIRSTKNIFEAGNILYGKLRPYLNKHGIAEFDGVCSTDILVFQTAPSVEKELLNRYFDLPQFISFAVSHSKGINLPRVSAKEILTARMPLPPLSEQHRLVARIESLFAKLDAAKEKVQSVLDSHETRKAALLHAAFTGKLTAKWREEHQTELRESKQFPSKLKSAPNHADALAGKWALVRLGDVIAWSSGGTPSRKHPEYYSGDIPWVKTGELNNTYIYDTSEKITKEAIAQSNAKVLPVNTVLLAMYGATIGKVGILGVEAATNQACACGICSEWVDYRFLFYYLQSQKSSFICSGKGGAQPNISQTIIKQYEFPLPSLPEQQEIIRILDRLLAREQRARQAAEETLAAIDRMKQAILARAFRGEL